MEEQIKNIINGNKYKPNTKLFVGNLNPETSDDDIQLNFSRFGKISMMDRKGSKDYVILEYEDAEAA